MATMWFQALNENLSRYVVLIKKKNSVYWTTMNEFDVRKTILLCKTLLQITMTEFLCQVEPILLCARLIPDVSQLKKVTRLCMYLRIYFPITPERALSHFIIDVMKTKCCTPPTKK